VHIPVGGGIVADSEPAAEWDETEVKARAFRALCAPVA
jgi:anthranilate/para-aminobenzoate synthase component I